MIREEVPVVLEALDELKESEEGKKKKILLTEEFGVVKENPFEGMTTVQLVDVDTEWLDSNEKKNWWDGLTEKELIEEIGVDEFNEMTEELWVLEHGSKR